MEELSNKIFIKIQSLLIYEVNNKNCLKTLMTKISHISWGVYDKGFYGKSKRVDKK